MVEAEDSARGRRRLSSFAEANAIDNITAATRSCEMPSLRLETREPMDGLTSEIPTGYSILATAGWFAAGGTVTAVFSGSLAKLAVNAGLVEVLAVGMFVPCFTWVVQLGASGLLLPVIKRRFYWGDLGRVCLLGSVALLPAACANLWLYRAPLWVSAANVLGSVVLMGGKLFRRSARHGIAPWWPASWCLTITVNVMLFVWASWGWWRPA
jgi:hypothetical protein